LIEEEKKP
jgi:hypothetical protein